MINLTQIQVPAPSSVNAMFKPIRFQYGWQATSTAWANDGGFYQITVGTTIAGQATVGDNVYIAWTSGTRPNWAKITGKTATQIIVDIVWDAAAHVATVVRIAEPVEFSLQVGYSGAPGNAVKPQRTVATFKVRPNRFGILDFDVSGFLVPFNSVLFPDNTTTRPFDLVAPFIVAWDGFTSSLAYAIYSGNNITGLAPYGSICWVNSLGNPVEQYHSRFATDRLLFFTEANHANPAIQEGTYTYNWIGGAKIDFDFDAQAGILDEQFFQIIQAPPAWLTLKTANSGQEIIGFQGTIPNGADGFTFEYLYDDGSNPSETWVFNINVLATVATKTVCSAKPIVWLHENGCYSTYYFDTVTLFGLQQGSMDTYLTAAKELVKYQQNDVYNTITFTTSLLNEAELDIMRSLLTSVAVWYDGDPIVIDPISRDLYQNKKFSPSDYQFSIKARFAQQVIIPSR